MELFIWNRYQKDCCIRTSFIDIIIKKEYSLDKSITDHKFAWDSKSDFAHCFIYSSSARLQHCNFTEKKLWLLIPSQICKPISNSYVSLLANEIYTENCQFQVIGIVPVTNDNEVSMHIVEGCYPNKKTIPLNKPNFSLCCGECNSYSVDQFVVFVPGKKAVKKQKNLSKASQLNITNRCI